MLASSDSIVQLDNGLTSYGTYVIYSSGKATKMLLYNSDYYTSGTRSKQQWVISNLPGAQVGSVRLTSSSATAVGSTGAANRPNISGLGFEDGTCKPVGDEKREVSQVSCGSATFTVAATEMLLLYLDNTGGATCN